LCRHHVDVGVQTGLVTVHLQAEELLGVVYGGLLFFDLLGIKAYGCQIILDLLEGHQHGLTVCRQIGVVDGRVLSQLGPI